MRLNEKLIDVLHDIAEYLGDRQDVVDGSYGEPRPNKEMSLLDRLEPHIENLKRAGEADKIARDLCQALSGNRSYKP